ncbi:TPA: beta-glucuronidase [bacterium]|nr:beta-glucuronidase [bacterium]
MLYPKESETREVKNLSGVWRFKVDRENTGLEEAWYSKPLEDTIPMPVPSSYNDVTQDISIRDHIGYVWYEREFFVPSSWKDKRIFIRIGSASHFSIVWINGEKVLEHKGGFLPFEAEITQIVKFDGENRLTVAVSNILDWTTLPPGEMRAFNDPMHPPGYKTLEYYFDFYNYSGIHRPVYLYTVPENYISDIRVTTDIKGFDGEVSYRVEVKGKKGNVEIILMDKNKREISKRYGEEGTLTVRNAQFWEPDNPYLYTFKVNLYNDNKLEDSYSLQTGIRKVEIKDDKFLLNGKPVYFKGFGKHEDSNIRGKGFDPVIVLKDFYLLKWINANSFRTSHYPYAEEVLDLADEFGILVIDEAPAVGMNMFSLMSPGRKVFSEERAGERTLEYHIQVMKELIARDKNHPSVVMWSVANEPASQEDGAEDYFRRVIAATRSMDPTRPVTLVDCMRAEESKTAKYVDVICINRYYSWYTDSGNLDIIEYQLEKDILDWYARYKKPVFLTEYGADTIAGLHQDPPVMFTEEYQEEMIKRFNNVLDRLSFVIGEHVWCFADFVTKQGIIRVMGNRKGVFTRERYPKKVAFYLKERWESKKA